jgi:hypothetical protein
MPNMNNAYALVVGISEYHNVRSLPKTVLQDAKDIKELLVNPNYCGYLKENVTLLLDQEATKDAVVKAFQNLADESDRDSTIFIYISSHGETCESGSYAGEYLLPVNADITYPHLLAGTSISSHEITTALRAITARKVIVIFDCCHSGGIGQPKGPDAPILTSGLSNSYYQMLAQGQGRVVLASSRSDEKSYVFDGEQNSLFTKHFLAGLKGGISSNDGLIRIFDIFEYLQPLVTGEQRNQHPIFKAEIEENFPIALYLGGEKESDSRIEDIEGQKEMIPKGGESFRYDAYISYVDSDAVWVWDILVPLLEEVGLKIAVSSDSEIAGVARVVNIERGITQAKRTIVVLTDAYLADNVTDFENVLGQTMGIQEGTYRLLPVKAQPLTSNVPIRLSMLATLDLVHPRRAEREFDRLIKALQDPLPTR